MRYTGLPLITFQCGELSDRLPCYIPVVAGHYRQECARVRTHSMGVVYCTRHAVILAVLAVAGVMLTLWTAHPYTWSAGNSYLGLHMTTTPLETNLRAGSYDNSSITSTGLIIINSLSGQQGSAMKGLLSFQCWVAPLSLPMYIQEFKFNAAMKMSDLVDLQHFNHASNEHGEPQLAKLDEPAASYPSNVIVLNGFHLSRHCKSNNYSTTVLDIQDGARRGCLNQDHGKYPIIQTIHNPCVVRVVESICLPLDPPAELKVHLFGNWNPRDSILLIHQWRYRLTRSMSRCTGTVEQDSIRRKLTSSKRLNEDARYYVDTFLNSQLLLAVMIRSERVSVGNMKSCLTHVLEAVSNISMRWDHTVTGRNGTLLTLDVGQYGSGSRANFRKPNVDNKAKKRIMKSVEDMVGHIYGEAGWSFKDWEQSYINASRGMAERTYFGALQRTLASQADCLILMGGGSFQEVAFNSYLALHPDKSKRCVQAICATKKFIEQLQIEIEG